jgi:hypothetical protein
LPARQTSTEDLPAATRASRSPSSGSSVAGFRRERKLLDDLPNLGDIDFGQITPLQLPQRIYDRLHSRGPYVAHQEGKEIRRGKKKSKVVK